MRGFVKYKEDGVIALEACVTVLSFLVLMLMLSSLFVMFMAQNATAHTILQTSQSLSIEAYSVNKLTRSSVHGTVGDVVLDIVRTIGGLFKDDDPAFIDRTRWFESTDQSEVVKVVRARFVGYLAGGDETKADKLLKSMNVVGGLSGLDFSGSNVDGGMLNIVLKYELEYDFNLWKVKTVPVEQSASAKIWK